MEKIHRAYFLAIKTAYPRWISRLAFLLAHYYLNGVLCACVEYRQNVAVDLYAVANNRLNAL